jgi:dipeptidyl-peptidase-4
MADRLTIADISHLPLPGTDVPGSIGFSPDGSAITYLHSADGSLVRSLWWHDLASGERWIIAGPSAGTDREESLSLEEKLRRERTRTSELGVTSYAWLPHAARPTLVVPLGGRAYIGGDGSPVREVPGVDGASALAASPDGSRLAFVRDGDVWVVDLADGASPPRRLTSDAEPGVFNGLAEFIAAEELARYDGMWWSGDGRHLAAAHVDERAIPIFVIAHLGAAEPSHEEHRYPFAGGPNATVTLRILDTVGGGVTEVALDIGDGYLARVVPESAGSWLVALLPRRQRSLRWLRMTTDGSVRELWTEESEPWINVDDHTRALHDGHILRSSERTGFRHLELRSPDGELLGPLTAGEWVVTGVAAVDEAGEVLFTATAEGPAERHLYATDLRPSSSPPAARRLTREPGWHEVTARADGSMWADTWSTREAAPAVRLVRRDRQEEPVVLHASAGSAGSFSRRPPERLSLVAADGATPLDVLLYRPERPAATPPPSVVWAYGGPHQQYVKESWEPTVSGLRQYLAQCGVAVVVVDNRGSNNRGLAFEAPLAGHFGGVELDDQAAAVEQLAAAGELDASRVGITGGSYGGFMTLMALIQRPDVFRVGVAVAPVSDQRGYDTAYSERYLGDPNEDPGAYDRSSPLPRATELRGSLLIIHGAIDENVHLRHSVRFLAALQTAGRNSELVLLPEDRHRARSPSGLRTRDLRTVEFLLTGLDVPLPDEVAEGVAALAGTAGAPRAGTAAAEVV